MKLVVYLWRWDPTISNNDFFVTIASTGNAVDFGDLTITWKRLTFLDVKSPTRTLLVGGRLVPQIMEMTFFVTIASTGNAQDFGDLIKHKM